MDFNFFLPNIHINIKGQIQFEANWTQIDRFILKKPQICNMAISQNAILAKWQSPKSLHFLWICLKLLEST